MRKVYDVVFYLTVTYFWQRDSTKRQTETRTADMQILNKAACELNKSWCVDHNNKKNSLTDTHRRPSRHLTMATIDENKHNTRTVLKSVKTRTRENTLSCWPFLQSETINLWNQLHFRRYPKSWHASVSTEERCAAETL